MLWLCAGILLVASFLSIIVSPKIVYLEYDVLNDSCEETGLFYFIPLSLELNDIFSSCTVFFTGKSQSIKFSYSSAKHVLSVFEYQDDHLECSNDHLIHSSTLNLGMCYIGSESTFNHSKFVIHEDKPIFFSGLEAEKDLFVSQYFSGQNNECTENEYVEHEVMKTNTKIGRSNVVFRCNDTYGIVTGDENITSVRDFEKTKCRWDKGANFSALYSCEYSHFLKSLESSCLSTTDFYMANNFGRENHCHGNNILQQLTIHNGMCFPINEYEKGTFTDLFKNMESKYGLLVPFESSARQYYGALLFEENKNSNFMLVELFENNFDCSSQPVVSKIYIPGCQTVNEGSENYSPNMNEWLFPTPGRIAVIPISSCEGLGKEEVSRIVEKAVKEKNFDFVSSLTGGACYNSDFDFYSIEDESSSVYGYCAYDPVTGGQKSSFEKYYDSRICDSWSRSTKHSGFICMDRTNYNNQSALYSCVQDYFSCFGKSKNSRDVCSSHGSCIKADDCKCQSLYYGKKCEYSVIVSCVILILGFSCCCCFSVSLIMCVCCLFATAMFTCLFIFSRKKQYDHLIDNTVYVNESFPLLKEMDRNLGGDKVVVRSRTPIFRSLVASSIKKEVYSFEGNRDGDGRIFQIISKTKHLIFSGTFKDGKRNGKGIEYFIPGKSSISIVPRKSFEGMFRDDKRHGDGIEYTHSIMNNEIVVRGVWKNGEIVTIEREYVDLPKIKVSEFKIDYVNDLIGSGSEGDIFLVEYEGKEAALKILRNVCGRESSSSSKNLPSPLPSTSSSFPDTDRKNVMWSYRQNHKFVRSQKLWSKVSHHPFILDLYAWTGIGLGPNEKMGYLTEKCKMSLRDAIVQSCLDWEHKIRILYEISVAMAYLHKLSIMHRDLKIGNVLLDEYSCTAKICDFEFSRFDERDWKNAQSDLSVLGTPVYIAPEIILGESYSKSCDVFSFGMLVYCVVFGVVSPYHGVDECNCGMNLSRPGIVFIPQHVAECSLRPPIRESEELKSDKWIVDDLILPSLEADPSERPSFNEIVGMFKKNKRNFGRKEGVGSQDMASDGEKVLMTVDDDSLTIN